MSLNCDQDLDQACTEPKKITNIFIKITPGVKAIWSVHISKILYL